MIAGRFPGKCGGHGLNSSTGLHDDSACMNTSPHRAPAYVGRFAPSPTGPLHFGSLLAAFGSWLLARHAGGKWLIRIEDVDATREVPGAATLQIETLKAFGLEPGAPIVKQSTRGDLYQSALDALLQSGDAFVCHCSRGDLAASNGVHRHCVAAQPRPDPAIRLRVPDGCMIGFVDGLQGRFGQDIAHEVGDFVLKRADGLWAYQLAVVVDDAQQGISDVVRGADLLDSTPRQILLQRALGLPTPRYSHLPLVLDGNGHKLSKSQAALPIDADEPLPPLRAAWHALGQAPHELAGANNVDALLARATARFDPARLPRVPALQCTTSP